MATGLCDVRKSSNHSAGISHNVSRGQSFRLGDYVSGVPTSSIDTGMHAPSLSCAKGTSWCSQLVTSTKPVGTVCIRRQCVFLKRRGRRVSMVRQNIDELIALKKRSARRGGRRLPGSMDIGFIDVMRLRDAWADCTVRKKLFASLCPRASLRLSRYFRAIGSKN